MPNFPSKWFDFLNQKEIKRLRRDVKDNFWLKIQIMISFMIAVLTLIFNDSLKALSLGWQIGISVSLCFLIVLIFLMPWIVKSISLLRSNNILVEGRIASCIFDEEVVYNVLVACEFYSIYNTAITGILSNELKLFYKIEIEYYIRIAIEKLGSFNSNIVNIIGNDKDQISSRRANNITNMIDTLITAMNLQFDNELIQDYNDFKRNIS